MPETAVKEVAPEEPITISAIPLTTPAPRAPAVNEHEGLPYRDIPVADIYVCQANQSTQSFRGINQELVEALAHSIGLIGLQNPIVVTPGGLYKHKFTIVSGRHRLAAFKKLNRKDIPAHILVYPQNDDQKETRTKLAELEENVVRHHYALIDLCIMLGQAKATYEQLNPEAQKGKAKKPKHSGTELFPKPLAYLDIAAQQFQKSRGTVWKYLHIYQRLIQAYPGDFGALQRHQHPILQKVEDLSTLAGLKADIPDLIRRMVGAGEERGVTRTLQEARQWLDAKKAQASQASSSSSAVPPLALQATPKTVASSDNPSDPPLPALCLHWC